MNKWKTELGGLYSHRVANKRTLACILNFLSSMVPTKDKCREQNQIAHQRQKSGYLELILVHHLTVEVFSSGNSDTEREILFYQVWKDTEGIKKNCIPSEQVRKGFTHAGRYLINICRISEPLKLLSCTLSQASKISDNHNSNSATYIISEWLTNIIMKSKIFLLL